MEQTSELLPCPFCGHSAKVTHSASPGGTSEAFIICSNKACRIRPHVHGNTLAAKSRWNTRAAFPASPVSVKDLVWEGDCAHTGFGLFYHIDHATGTPGFVVLEKCTGSSISKSGQYDIPAAKAAAQADYERRILSALSTEAGGAVPEREQCATEGCEKRATHRLERFGVGSTYCQEHYEQIGSILKPSPSQANAEVEALTAALLEQRDFIHTGQRQAKELDQPPHEWITISNLSPQALDEAASALTDLQRTCVELHNSLAASIAKRKAAEAKIATLEKQVAELREASPDDLRADGWAIAVHNDYRQGGKPMTFWLFTKDGRAVKGEGNNDREALSAARQSLGEAK